MKALLFLYLISDLFLVELKSHRSVDAVMVCKSDFQHLTFPDGLEKLFEILIRIFFMKYTSVRQFEHNLLVCH